ncbi:MAG: hypothetical protein IT168_22800 [Bryobacterales bacterium]|nr:hypothetical protein [Bryobacterales bacterium]
MNPNPNSDPDPGAPIDLLHSQEEEPGADFIAGVRRKIHRRAVTAQFAAYSWQMPKLVLTEVASVFGHVVRTLASYKDSR